MRNAKIFRGSTLNGVQMSTPANLPRTTPIPFFLRRQGPPTDDVSTPRFVLMLVPDMDGPYFGHLDITVPVKTWSGPGDNGLTGCTVKCLDLALWVIFLSVCA